MLVNGLNHVAILTGDTDRLHEFYREVFGATVPHDATVSEGLRFSLVEVGPFTALNVLEVEGNTEAQRQAPAFERGRIDHLGLQAASAEAFDEIRRRLLARGCTDGFVTDFGSVLSLFFRDPDGLEAEVRVPNPDGRPGVYNPPGTPARGYERVLPG